MKYNKKGIVLVPIMITVLMFIFLGFLFIKMKYKSTQIQNQQIYNTIASNIDSGKQDLMIKEREGKKISNPQLLGLGKEKYDDGTINLFNVIDGIQGDNDINADKIQFIDKIITNKTSEFKVLNENLPSKTNNVFEIELTDFIDNNGNIDGRIDNLKIDWGTNSNNTTPFYIVMSRIRKNATITIDDNYLVELSQLKSGKQNGTFGKTSNDINNFSFDYIKIPGGSICTGQTDKDFGFQWCKSTIVTDFLSNSYFDTNQFFYKMYLVFGFQDGNEKNTPFRITSSDGLFGLGNIDNLDVTLLTPDNAKKRIVIKTANKNNVLPYLIYSLWVKGQVQMTGDDS